MCTSVKARHPSAHVRPRIQQHLNAALFDATAATRSSYLRKPRAIRTALPEAPNRVRELVDVSRSHPQLDVTDAESRACNDTS